MSEKRLKAGQASARAFECVVGYFGTIMLRFVLALLHELKIEPFAIYIYPNLASYLVIETLLLEALPSGVVLLLLLRTVAELEQHASPSMLEQLTEPLSLPEDEQQGQEWDDNSPAVSRPDISLD